MDLQLENRVALVAAASQGLGYATALQLSRERALVAICSRDEARVAAAADAITAETGCPVLGVPADVTKREDIERLVERVVDEYGGLDVVVTNAGGPPGTTFDNTSDEQWRAAFDLSLMSTVWLIRAALPHLRQSTVPAVLTITSISVKQPIPNLLLSNSIRMAVIGLTKSLANELGREGIRFNSILPGWTETERVHDLLTARANTNKTTLDEELKKQGAAIPLGRIGKPQEFGNVATFLVSPAASFVNGAALQVDGGNYMGVF